MNPTLNHFNPVVRLALSVMMFLQFFIWGSWYVTAPNYLGTIGFNATDFGWTYSVGPIAGMLSPILVGVLADRFFSAQKVLAILHLLGGGIMLAAAEGMEAGFKPSSINSLFFAYMLAYYPSLALANTIAMRNMPNPERQFPGVRALGGIGWIIAGVGLSAFGWGTKIEMFRLAACASFVLGGFAFFLPDTPPSGSRSGSLREMFSLDALVLLKNRSYQVFIICSTLICIPLAFYYQITSRLVEMVDFGGSGILQSLKSLLQMGDVIGATMSLGQVSEIIFMLVMPFFFARLGVKWMLAVGMLAWIARYTLFALGAPDQIRWMILIGILLHGVCYDFFFVTGQIFTDRIAPKELRGQAQGMLVFFTLGVGMFVGAQVAGRVESFCTTAESRAFASEITLLQLEAQTLEQGAGEKDSHSATGQRISEIRNKEIPALRKSELEAIDWKPLWGIPAAFAGIVLLAFLMLFKSPQPLTKHV
jgi:nucleoside transporter